MKHKYLIVTILVILVIGLFTSCQPTVSPADLTAVQNGVQTNSDSINNINAQLATMNASLTQAQSNVTNIQKSLTNYATTAILSNYVTTDDVKTFATVNQIATVNTQLTSLNDLVTKAQSDITTVKNSQSSYATKTSVDTLTSSVSSVQSSITTINKSITDLTAKIPDIKPLQDSLNAINTGLTASLKDINAKIDKNSIDIATLKTQVATLQSQVASILTPTSTTTTNTSPATVTASVVNLLGGSAIMQATALPVSSSYNGAFTIRINNNTGKTASNIKLAVVVYTYDNTTGTPIPVVVDQKLVGFNLSSGFSSGTPIFWLTQPQNTVPNAVVFLNTTNSLLGGLNQAPGIADYQVTFTMTTSATGTTPNLYLIPSVIVLG